MDGPPAESVKEAAASVPEVSEAQSQGLEQKADVDAVWEKMNKGVSTKTLKSILNNSDKTVNRSLQKDNASRNWMSFLGLGLKRTESKGASVGEKRPATTQNGTSDEAKMLAAAALAAAKDAAASAALAKGKIEVTEVRDFAGQEIEVKKLLDPSSKEAAERAKASASSAVDAVLEQIKKKPKLSLLDKTKKDWGEFKEENRGLEDELDAYKKSANQYLDKVSFLQRTDYREFERERDARLAIQARRRPDMREGP